MKTNMNEIAGTISRLLTEIHPDGTAFSPQESDSLLSHGIDSMGYIKLILGIEEYYDIELEDSTLFFDISTTILKIAGIVWEQMENKPL